MGKQRSRLKQVDAKILTPKTANEILHTIDSQMADRVHRNWRQELLVPREPMRYGFVPLYSCGKCTLRSELSDSGNRTTALEGIYIVQRVSLARCLLDIIRLLLP